MATTNATLAAAALDALRSHGIEFAFLHREREAARGVLASDYDLVVRAPDAADLLQRVDRALRRTGLRPVIATEYDAGSVALWLTTGAAEDGVQLDFVYDPHGVNQFDLPLTNWLDTATEGERWRRIGPEQERAYRERKHAFKARTWKPRRRASRVAAEVCRIRGRLRWRAGFWLHMVGENSDGWAEVLVDRFARILPASRLIDFGPRFTIPTPDLRNLIHFLYRPALVITRGPTPPAGPDLVVDTSALAGVEILGKVVVETMAARIRTRFNATPSGAGATTGAAAGTRWTDRSR